MNPEADDEALYRELCRLYDIDTRIWAAAERHGLHFVSGCCCCGGNTPDLMGYCPCRGIDLRSPEAAAEIDAISEERHAAVPQV